MKFWIRIFEGEWVEVTEDEFVQWERRAGFRNTLGEPEQRATQGFIGHGRIEGRVTTE